MSHAQILLRDDQEEALSEMAKKEGRSVPEVVRELVDRELERRRFRSEEQARQRLAALARVGEHRRERLAAAGGAVLDLDVAALVHELREERDEELLEHAFGRR